MEYDEKNNQCCIFCKTGYIDNAKYGQLSKTGKTYAHYFCTLLSSTITQSGADNQGIEGFTLNDIRKEVARKVNVLCYYCRRPGANITCAELNCDKSFHLPCGIERKILSQFFGSYLSYCRRHRPRQTIPDDVLRQEHHCAMCLSEINFKFEIDDIIWATCCSRNMFMHRRCGQNYAFIAAAAYQCPNCKNRETFVELSRYCGIFVPDRDAQWEYERVFDDQLVRLLECTQEKCFAKTRDTNKLNTLWEVLMCEDCGSQGTHRFCSDVDLLASEWRCFACTPGPSTEVDVNLCLEKVSPCSYVCCQSPGGRYFEDEDQYRKIACHVCKTISVHRRCANVDDIWYCQLHEHLYKRKLIVKLEDIFKTKKLKYS